MVNANQGQVSSYLPSTAGSEAVSWTVYKVDISSTENGIHPNSAYHYEQNMQPPVSSSSSLGTVNAPQDYNGYAAYNPTDPYGYGSTGYSGYYSGYQQQPNPSYSQTVGAHQNTGAPYQPISSFPNSGSYAGSSSYSSTYYNPGDYQTAEAYSGSSYNNQNTQWNDTNYANYNPQQYAPYNSGTTAVYNSSAPTATSVNYQQHYKQWPDYYTQSEVTCAPGTENSSVTGVSSFGCPAPAATPAYSTSNSQQQQQPLPPPPPPPLPLPPPPPPPPYTPYWRPESSSSELPSVQV